MLNILKAVAPDTFETEVLQSKVPVIVDFWAPWCAPCRQLTPRLEKLAIESEQFGVKVVTVDCEKYRDFAKSLGVSAVPTLTLYIDGKPEYSAIGGQAPLQVVSMFTKALNRDATID